LAAASGPEQTAAPADNIWLAIWFPISPEPPLMRQFSWRFALRWLCPIGSPWSTMTGARRRSAARPPN